jgi:hypothetical protein
VSDEVESQQEESTGEEQSTGKGLRAQLERALAEKAELQKQFDDVSRKARHAELTSLLTARELNPKLAKFIPADVQGDDGLDTWLKDNGELFGIEAPKPQADPKQVDPAVREAAQRVQGLAQSSSAPAGFGDLSERVKGANSKEELQALVDEARRYTLR